MPTNRKVIDFKIHNLTEEQFQELKEAGQIDPNAIYCTPDETVANFEKVNARIDTKQDVATAINYGHVTNCITEIPQDIKLELNNGVLTLKAGSKVYVPNGVGNFDELVIQNDLTTISTWGEQVRLGLFVKSDGSTMFIINMEERCSSGSTPPTATNTQMWYDTTNNLVKRYGNGSDTGDRYSLPIALVQKGDAVESSNISSIDQVFNGFGYIGSTVFALSGVKGLIPNGRNADGSLNNIEVTTPTIRTMTMASYMASRNDAVLTIFGNSELGGMDINQNTWGTVKRLTDIVRPSYYACYYCLEDNLVHYFNGSGVESIRPCAFIGFFNVDSNNRITQFAPKTPFRAVDYNDLPDTISLTTPAGIVTAFAGTTPPAGWLKCDGSAISRTKYAKLFAAIGTTYGTGDGSTTFNLPNLIGRVPLGMTAEYIGQSSNGVLPNITGRWEDYTNSNSFTDPTGAFWATSTTARGGIGSGYNFYSRTISFGADRSSTLYDSASKWYSGSRVIPSSLSMNYCIKY